MSDKKYQSIKKYAKLTLKKNGKKKERKNEQKKRTVFLDCPEGGEQGKREREAHTAANVRHLAVHF